MKFFIGNTEYKIEIAPQITETFDETLDTAQVVLKANSTSNPYAPMQECHFDFETTPSQLIYMYILNDQVELFSISPLTYKHTLTLIQKSRELSKLLVRDSVFSQPMNNKKNGYSACSYVRERNDGDRFRTLATSSTAQYFHWVEPLHISYKDKSFDKKIKYKLSIYYFETISARQTGDIKKATSLSEISTAADPRFELLFYANNAIASSLEIDSNHLNTWNEIDISQYMGTTTDLYFTVAANEPINKSGVLRVIVHVDYYIETFYYTVYDILNLLIERYNLLDPYHYEGLINFSLPSSGTLYDLLTNTIAPNFTFTGMTMYECFAEVFKLFDAIFTITGNGILDIEYFNEYTGEINENMNFSSSNLQIAEEKYNNKIVNYYQDARIEKTFPSSNGFVGLRTSELGVPSKQAYNILLPHPIYQLNEIKIEMPQVVLGFINENQQQYAYFNFPDGSLDITRYVVEKSLWSLLNSTNVLPISDNYMTLTQLTTTYYSKGGTDILFSGFYKDATQIEKTNIVNLLNYAVRRWSGYAYTDVTGSGFYALPASYDAHYLDFANDCPPSSERTEYKWQNLFFNVKYLTSLNGKVQIDSITDKFKGEMLVGQQSGAVDLFKLGLNMQGLSLKLGEPTMTMTHKITNWNDRIKKGQYIIKDGNRWIANICQYTLFNDKMVGTIDFSKNFNALSQRIKLNQEKRLSVIDKSLVQKSEILLMEYVYASSVFDNTKIKPSTEYMYFDDTYLYHSFSRTFKYVYAWKNTIDYAEIKSCDYNGAVYHYTDRDGNSKNVEKIYVPLNNYACGNTLCFECSFEDSKSAGNRLQVSISGWWFFTSSTYYSYYIPYTDENGFMDRFTLKFKNSYSSNSFKDLPDLDNQYAVSDEIFAEIENFKCWKQPNEIFALNYQLSVMPIPQRKDIDFIGSKMIYNNALISSDKFFKPDTFYFHYSTTETYDILDTKGIGNRILISEVTPENDSLNYYFRISFIHNGNLQNLNNIKSWAICDSEKNIYFASNSVPIDKDFVDIHFYPRHVKLS